jgi:hypothetical protein
MTLLRLLESVHGHLGILAAVALLHPAILLRKGRALSRGLWWSVVLTTAFVVLAFATGIAIYDDYRELVKPDLFRADPTAGLLFETKEHAAWAVLVLSLGAGVVATLAPKESNQLRQSAALMYAVAFAISAITVALGTYVAAVRGFPM